MYVFEVSEFILWIFCTWSLLNAYLAAMDKLQVALPQSYQQYFIGFLRSDLPLLPIMSNFY